MNILGISKPKLESLLNRGITLFDSNWSKTGAIYTPNLGWSFEFIYSHNQKTIGSISLEEKELVYVFSNLFWLCQRKIEDSEGRIIRIKHGVLLYSEKESGKDYQNPNYLVRSEYLDKCGRTWNHKG